MAGYLLVINNNLKTLVYLVAGKRFAELELKLILIQVRK